MRNIILALVTGVAVLVAVPAAAATNHRPAVRPHTATVGCTWDACTGQDPFAMGCNKDEVNLDVDLYYSPTCQAAWAQLTNAGGGVVPAAVIWYVASGGGAEQDLSGTAANVPEDAPFSSPMVTWNDSVRGCWTTNYGTGVTISDEGNGLPGNENSFWSCGEWY